jgi:hypothetical protein
MPRDQRVAELRRDYRQVEPMFLVSPPSFDEVLQVLQDAEKSLNNAVVMI